MAQFDELQTLWQTQPSAATPPFDPAPLSGAFRRFGRRQDIINVAKFAIVIWAVVRCFTAFRDRPLTSVALGGILLSAAVALVAEWRIQRGIARLNFTAPSIDFVRAAVARLHAQRNPYHTRAYLFLFTAIFAAYNLITYAAWQRLTVERRILLHGLASISPIILYAFVADVERRRLWVCEGPPCSGAFEEIDLR